MQLRIERAALHLRLAIIEIPPAADIVLFLFFFFFLLYFPIYFSALLFFRACLDMFRVLFDDCGPPLACLV